MSLFRAFRVEQTDPARFYGALADDAVDQLLRFTALAGEVVLDVGGGPGYFGEAFERAGASYAAVDADLGELSARGHAPPRAVLGSGTALPVRSGVVDVTYSSNVLEHVAEPWTMADEMLRVTRPGGLVYLSYTNWLSPHGGHETGAWHYLGGDYARRRYCRTRGREPKNRYGESLFPVSVTAGLHWGRARARSGHAVLVDAFPRYHPWWAAGVVRVPGLREFATWNLVLVLRRTGVPMDPRGKTGGC